MPTKASIYSNCNPQLTKLFADAGHPARLMCVALDYAKRQHTALICDGAGELLKSAFPVDNSKAGLNQLVTHVRRLAKERRIALEHVFFGGEDCPSFAENFLRQLQQARFLVVRVNAWEAKQQRDNFQASTDSLDLLGIARCCLKRRGQPVLDHPQAYANLRIATRDRDKIVRTRTAISNRIHSYADRLFPGFLDQSKSGLRPFSLASLEMMSQRFSAQQIQQRPLQRLTQWLAGRGVDDAKTLASQLKELAKNTNGPAPEQTALLQHTLSQLIELYRDLQTSISSTDREVAFWLARTPGALLTSIGGFGITLAAGWTAELGPPAQWRALRRLCSYAGVVPRTKQTGGPDSPPVTGPVQQRSNKRLKNVVLQAVEKVMLYGPEDLRHTAAELDARQAHTTFAIAKRLLRLGKCLALSGAVYRPKALLDANTSKEALAEYYRGLWDKLLEKWRDKADLNDVFAPQHPLGQWRQMVKELYAQDLPLPRQLRTARAKTR
jgi:transposase